MTSGFFISFEGIDGAGKSTHIQAVAESLRVQGRTVVLTREPGGTPLSEQLREMVLHQDMDALTEALLMFAARREHLVQVIEPALARGDTVLCDRFTDATLAYQGGGRGFDWQVLLTLEHMVQRRQDGALCQPDLTFWFDVPPEVAAARLTQARSPDKFESQDLRFFSAVREGYRRRLEADPKRFVVIDAHQGLAQVRAAVLATLSLRVGSAS